MANVKFKKVFKAYRKDNNVICDFDMQINDGEFVVLIGPSGCGKTTLLRMIAGLEKITQGEILINNKVINNIEPKDRNVAMVFQNYALYPHLTIYDNLAFYLKLKKEKKDAIVTAVLNVTKLLGLEELLDRKPSELSGGQRQRVAIGRAMIRKPQVFLFDEPLSNLDTQLRNKLKSEIAKLHLHLKSTFIYVTHDQNEAMTLADKIVMLNKGSIVQIDTPEQIYKNPKNIFVAEFLGSPTINIFDVKIINENKNYYIVFKDTQKILIPNDKLMNIKNLSILEHPILLGIRPNDMKISTNKQLNDSIGFKVDLIENFQNEFIVHLKLKNYNDTFRLKALSTTNYELNDEINIMFNWDNLLFFNIETQNLI